MAGNAAMARSFLQGEYLHLSKFHRMTLGLEGYGTFMEYLGIVDNHFLRIRVLFVKLRALIFQDDLAIDDVLDNGVAVDLDFHCHPLIAVIRLGAG